MRTRFVKLLGQSARASDELVVAISSGELGPMTLELSLLETKLASSVRLEPSRGPGVELVMGDRDRVSAGDVSIDTTGTVVFTLGRNQVGHLRMSLLRAYQDGFAGAQHLHIEGKLNGEPFDLTLIFDVYAPPLSEHEAEKLIFDDELVKR